MTIDTKNTKEYRKKIGFKRQDKTKIFFDGKDIIPKINFEYIESLNERLYEIAKKVNSVLEKSMSITNIDEFCTNNIDSVYKKLKQHQILSKLNNQGRMPEKVYFSWMRGFLMLELFSKSLGYIFDVNINKIINIGGDNLQNIKTFKRAPTADLEIKINNKKTRIEIQSGFQGINDIKQHKVLEAKKQYKINKIDTLAIHFDIFNGYAAFVPLHSIDDNSLNWVSRQQMEGQTVFNIDQNYFVWELTTIPQKITSLLSRQK